MRSWKRRRQQRKLLKHVVRAWTVPGRSPSWHLEIKQRIRFEWPTLATALDALAYNEQEA